MRRERQTIPPRPLFPFMIGWLGSLHPADHRSSVRSIVVIVALAAMIGMVGLRPGAPAVMAAPPVALPAQAAGDGALAIVGAGGANLYSAPGGDQVATLAAGAVLTAVGRSSDNLWIVVRQSGGAAGWVEVSQVVLFGISELPVMIEGGEAAAPLDTAGDTAPGGATPAAGAPVSLPTPTPTPTPSPTPRPTATPTPSPTPTPTPTVEPTAIRSSGTGTLVAVVRGGGAALYERPAGETIGQLTTGTALTAWGRSEDGQWLVVTTPGSAPGWVEAAKVVAFNLETLPVVGGAAAASVVGGEGGSVPAQSAQNAAPDNPAPDSPAAATTATDAIYATVAITDSRLNVRTGPGTTFAIVSKALPGESFVATGRNAQSTWVEIALGDAGDGYGWVAAEFVALSEPIAQLPVSERTGAMASSQPSGASETAVTTRVSTTGLSPTAVPTAKTVAAASAEAAGLAGRLVFQSYNGGQIYVYDLGSGQLAKLTGGFDPAISPDGRTVAFTRIGGENGLYLIDIDGRNERLIYSGGENLRAPAWSPDGQWISFVRISGSTSCRLIGFGICIPNFSNLQDLLEDFPLQSVPQWMLSRVNSAGEEYRDLASLESAQAPDWHPNGIVYSALSGIEITHDKPEVTTRAVIQAPFYQDPAWQPGGDRIVFQSQEGSHWEIFAVNPDGSGLTALTRPVTTLVDVLPSNVAPEWSPDGRWIVYLSNRDERNDAGDWRLWVMAADGSNQRPLPIDVPIDYTFGVEQVVSWGVVG